METLLDETATGSGRTCSLPGTYRSKVHILPLPWARRLVLVVDVRKEVLLCHIALAADTRGCRVGWRSTWCVDGVGVVTEEGCSLPPSSGESGKVEKK